jgi:Ca2+-binding EF-hand superfamily protein
MPTSAIRKCLAALGVPPTSSAELRELTETVDPDDSGYVPYEHFIAIAALKMEARGEEQEREEVEQAFRLFTREGGEKITLATLKRVAKELKENVDDQVLKDMIIEANGGAGVGRGVDIEQFEEVMKRAGVFR